MDDFWTLGGIWLLGIFGGIPMGILLHAYVKYRVAKTDKGNQP